MNNPMFKLNAGDFVRGFVTAVFAAIVTVLYQVTQTAGFDLFAADWGTILGQMVNVSLTVFVAYMAKNFLSEDNKVFGSWG